jgi:glutathionyl-hydroquinone reductase
MPLSQQVYVYRKAKALASWFEPEDGSIPVWTYRWTIHHLLEMGERMIVGDDVSDHIINFNDIFDEMIAYHGLVWDEEDFAWKHPENEATSQQEGDEVCSC